MGIHRSVCYNVGMSKSYIYVDDSGDTGLRKSNTTHFVVAAVVVVDREDMEKLAVAINSYRAGLRWNELHEFKFRSTDKKIIMDLLKHLQRFEFKSYAAVIDKTKIVNRPQLPSGETLYDYAIKELLLKLKMTDPVIVIDGVADKKPAQKTRTYLRQALKKSGVEKCKISFVDSRKDALVQLADIVAGSVARSYDKTKTDRKSYLKLLESKLKNIYDITP